jgi:ABC-2 type transport system ATP-binding protein
VGRIARRGSSAALTVQQLHLAVPAVVKAVEAEGATLRKLTTRQSTLDDVFLSLTGHSLREDEA